MIENWPTPENIRDVHVLSGLTLLYQWFIRKYAKPTTLISDQAKHSRDIQDA
jgi:hypothetical protein